MKPHKDELKMTLTFPPPSLITSIKARGIAILPDSTTSSSSGGGDSIIVSDGGNYRVARIDNIKDDNKSGLNASGNVSWLVIGEHVPLWKVEPISAPSDNDTTHQPKESLHWPGGVAYHQISQLLYIVDTQSHSIRVLHVRASTLRPVSWWTAIARSSNIQLGYPIDIIVDQFSPADDPTLYIADSGKHRIIRLYRGRLNIVAGTGKRGHVDGAPLIAQFAHPNAITINQYDNGALYVADTLNHVVRRIDINGNGRVTTVCGQVGIGRTRLTLGQSENTLRQPRGIDVDHGGRIFVADTSMNAIRMFVPESIRIARIRDSSLWSPCPHDLLLVIVSYLPLCK
jgi:hypothetical protein